MLTHHRSSTGSTIGSARPAIGSRDAWAGLFVGSELHVSADRADHYGKMPSDFGGLTAALYLRYRRDLPGEQAAQLAELSGLRPDDVLVDLGCGTGQLAVPMAEHCAARLGRRPGTGDALRAARPRHRTGDVRPG